MFTRLKRHTLILLCFIACRTQAQDAHMVALNIGDPAPPLRLREWLKGTPVQQFEKGRIYVVEFWATWCRPCIAEMPHLSALAHQYKGKLTVIGVDIYERNGTSMERIRSFVDSLGHRIDYNVAVEEGNAMAVAWVDALADPTIPKSFVINADGKIVWTGHPKMLDEVLPAILNNTWNIDEALAKRNFNIRLEAKDKEVIYQLLPFFNNDLVPNHPLKPDSMLSIINEVVGKEPALKYAPFMAYYTFVTLLHTDLQKAYEYGKAAIITSTYEEPAWYSISNAIELYGDKLNLPANLFLLGVEAEQARISHVPYPELVNLPRMYKQVASFYQCANEPSKAIDALQKAIAIMKSRNDFTAKELAELEFSLKLYDPPKRAF